MSVERFLKDVEIISKLGYNPGTDDGLSPDEVQAKFDEAAVSIKAYLNDVIVPALEGAEGGGIVMATLKPGFNPVLWLYPTEGNEPPATESTRYERGAYLLYVNAAGEENILYPKTKAANILDFSEKMQEFHLKKEDTLTVGKWNGASAPYTLTLSVPGVKADDDPHVGPVYSDDQETRRKQVESWNCVSYGKTGENKITFVCDDRKPETDIPIQIEVNR